MRRITLWLLTTAALVVLLFSYRTSTMGASTPVPAAAGGPAPGIVSGSTPNAAGAPPDDGSTGGPATGPGTPSAAPAAPKPGSNLVANGTVVQTRWGPVQVQVHVSGGKITDVTPLRVPNGNRRDLEINSYAVPQLHDEAIQAQSADIDAVSGATVTSEGYIRSLQSALDSAHFKG